MGSSFILMLGFLAGVLIIYIIGKLLVFPFKLLTKLIYNGLIGGLLLIVFNLIGSRISVTLPLNFETALIAGILGIPGVIIIFIANYFMPGFFK